MKYYPALYFGLLLLINTFRKRRFLSVSNLLIALYFFGSICFIVLTNIRQFSLSQSASIYYLVALSFFIIPHLFFDETKIVIKKANLSSSRIKRIFSFYIITQLICCFYFIPLAIRAFSGNIHLNRLLVNMGEWYTDSYLSLIISLIGSAWPISMTLFFFCIINNEKVKYSLGLFACSCFPVIYGLAHVGRSGITFWVMGFVFNYLIFRKLLRESKWRILKQYAIIALIIFFYIFGLISVNREFEEYYSKKVFINRIIALIDYDGQSYGNFNEFYQKNWLKDKVYYGKYSGSLFYGILETFGLIKEYSNAEVLKEINEYHSQNGLQPGTFNTFLKEISIDFGLWKSFILYGIYFILCLRLVLRNKSKLNMSNLFLYSFAFSIPYNGYYFFSYGSSLSNATAIYYLLAYKFARRYLV